MINLTSTLLSHFKFRLTVATFIHNNGSSVSTDRKRERKIDSYVELNLSKRDIYRRIRRSVHAITTYLNNKDDYGKIHKGRQRALSTRDCCQLRRAASNSSISSRELQSILGLSVSRSTICRTLNRMSLKHKRMKCRPPLTAAHKDQRMDFCIKITIEVIFVVIVL